jgi:hypothetical protein
VSDERGLRIRLLGNLAASYDGVAVDLGGPQQRAVLAMLVLYRDRGLSDDRIVEYLWDDQPPARALPTLQAYISHLRRRLEPQAAAGSRSGVIVRQGTRLSIAEFRQLGGALKRPNAGSALTFLDGEILVLGLALGGDPAERDRLREDAGRLLDALEPWTNGRQYLPMPDDQIDTRKAFPPDVLSRLVALRATLDPDRLFVGQHPLPNPSS